MKKNFINKFNQQNHVLEDDDVNLHNTVVEDSSTNYNEISKVKNILKISTPLPLEPSLYSPIHPDRRE